MFKFIKKRKERIRYYIIVSLILMLGLWLWFMLYKQTILLSLIWVASTIFNFVNSIRYLRCGGGKGLGVTSLVISSILIFLFSFWFVFGVFEGLGII